MWYNSVSTTLSNGTYAVGSRAGGLEGLQRVPALRTPPARKFCFYRSRVGPSPLSERLKDLCKIRISFRRCRGMSFRSKSWKILAGA
jgi:hypothetical protein